MRVQRLCRSGAVSGGKQLFCVVLFSKTLLFVPAASSTYTFSAKATEQYGAHLRESNVRRMMFPQVSDHRVLERRPAGLKRGHSHLCIPPELVETLNYEVLLRLERDADIYHEISEGFLA